MHNVLEDSRFARAVRCQSEALITEEGDDDHSYCYTASLNYVYMEEISVTAKPRLRRTTSIFFLYDPASLHRKEIFLIRKYVKGRSSCSWKPQGVALQFIIQCSS